MRKLRECDLLCLFGAALGPGHSTRLVILPNTIMQVDWKPSLTAQSEVTEVRVFNSAKLGLAGCSNAQGTNSDRPFFFTWIVSSWVQLSSANL